MTDGIITCFLFHCSEATQVEEAAELKVIIINFVHSLSNSTFSTE